MPDDYADAHKKKRDYICKVCWSELKITFGPNRTCIVSCFNDPKHTGITRRDIVENKIQHSHSELIEARHNLAAAMGIEEPQKSVDELLKSLGF